jgi:hypothetical protein
MSRYVDALDAVERYQQLPYTFRRRHNETPEIRDELARMLADVQVTLAFHRRRLRMDAAELGDAYGQQDPAHKQGLPQGSPRRATRRQGCGHRDQPGAQIQRGHRTRRVQKYLRLSRNIF